MIEIRHRYTNAVLYRHETAETTKLALEAAVASGAYLGGANLGGADLGGADLGGANLGGADLREAQDDLYEVFSSTPAEVPGLLAALRAGKVDGSTYEGQCACLVGTIAKVRACHYTEIAGLEPDASRPIERLFTTIRGGDTPATNPIAKIVEGWTEEWLLSNPVVQP
jgi:hypothetical protein